MRPVKLFAIGVGTVPDSVVPKPVNATDGAGTQPVLSMARRDYVSLALLALIWSNSFVLIKVAIETIPPISVAAGRLLIAAVVLLWVAGRNAQRLWQGWGAVGVYVFMGIFGNAAPFALIAFGEVHVDSSQAAILMGIMPVATLVLGHYIFSDERITFVRGVGIVLGFSGVVTMVGWQAVMGIGQQFWAQLAVLGGALCYSCATLFLRRFGRYPNRIMAAGACLAGGLALIPLTLYLEQPWQMQASLGSLGAVVVLGLLPTAFGALVYFQLVRRVGAGNFAQVNYLIPGCGVLWGMVLLGERPQPQSLLALGMILAGVWLVTRGGKKTQSARPK